MFVNSKNIHECFKKCSQNLKNDSELQEKLLNSNYVRWLKKNDEFWQMSLKIERMFVNFENCFPISKIISLPI